MLGLKKRIEPFSLDLVEGKMGQRVRSFHYHRGNKSWKNTRSFYALHPGGHADAVAEVGGEKLDVAHRQDSKQHPGGSEERDAYRRGEHC